MGGSKVWFLESSMKQIEIITDGTGLRMQKIEMPETQCWQRKEVHFDSGKLLP